MINEEFAPLLKARTRATSPGLGNAYSGSRAHYALREGRVFPCSTRGHHDLGDQRHLIARCGTFSAKLGVPVWRLLGGRRSTE